MPKILNYPLASFQKSLEVAEAADSLGGICNIETCAQKLNKKVSGGFMTIISSAQKYGLIEAAKGTITVTEVFKLIKHSYTEGEKNSLLRKAFLSPQVFYDIYQRFIGRELPINLLEKIMIREFGVDENVAGRVSGYFVDGLKDFGLIDSNNVIISEENEPIQRKEVSVQEPVEKYIQAEVKKVGSINSDIELNDMDNGFTIHIYGPRLNNKIKIEEEDDLLIVEAILNKIKKALKGADNQS